MREIGAAIVGTGFIGHVHVEALRRAGVRVSGILGSTPAKSGAAAKALGLPRAYDSFDEILADPDAHSVHLATPNRLHFDHARRRSHAGKHVLCEKPLAMTSKRDGGAGRVGGARRQRRPGSTTTSASTP